MYPPTSYSRNNPNYNRSPLLPTRTNITYETADRTVVSAEKSQHRKSATLCHPYSSVSKVLAATSMPIHSVQVQSLNPTAHLPPPGHSARKGMQWLLYRYGVIRAAYLIYYIGVLQMCWTIGDYVYTDPIAASRRHQCHYQTWHGPTGDQDQVHDLTSHKYGYTCDLQHRDITTAKHPDYRACWEL